MEEMKKPFSMDLDYAKLIEEGEEERKVRQENKMVKPFTMDLKMAKSGEKMYLVLYVYTCQIGEDVHDFEFIVGRQATYDRIKELLTSSDEDEQLDAMRSLVFVDSPKIQISKRLSIYSFMKDMKLNNKINDDTSFDINDYYYEVDENEEQE